MLDLFLFKTFNSETDTETETRKAKTQKDKNLALPKYRVENADLYKPVHKKIMTTRE